MHKHHKSIKLWGRQYRYKISAAKVGLYNIALMLFCGIFLWKVSKLAISSADTEAQNQLESILMSAQTSNGIFVDHESDASEGSALASEIGSDVHLSPELKGFMVISTTKSHYIYPDLENHMEFRTSQLAIFNGKAFASRRVLYRSEAKPQVVVVMALNANWNTDILLTVLKERRKYCELNNYGLYARYIQDFAAENRPLWESLGLASIRLLRQSMLAFPDSEWFWYYDANGHIIYPEKKLLPLSTVDDESLQLAMNSVHFDTKLKSLATDAHQANIILSVQPEFPNNLSSNSIMLKRSLPTSVFLEILGDPTMQNYGDFAKHNDHAGQAITHLLRWHPFLAKSIAIIPPEWSGNNLCDDLSGIYNACTPI